MPSLVCLAFALQSLAAQSAPPPVADPPALPHSGVAKVPDDFPAIFDKATAMISRSFYARKDRAQELKDRFARYKPKAAAVKTREEFSALMDQMIEEFGDSHFDFLPDFKQGYYMFDALQKRNKAQEMPEFGAWLRPAKDGGYTVQMVLNNSNADKAGLRKGDVVMSINGQPFSPVKSMDRLINQTVKLDYVRGGKSFQTQVDVASGNALEMFLDASRRSTKVIERDGKKFGYFHLWTQANDQFADALNGAINFRLSKTDGLILDLRDGFGGIPTGFVDQLFLPGVPMEMGGRTSKFGYDRPVVLIINEGSRSAKEIVSKLLQVTHRATLVGHHTAGHVLGTTPQRLCEWAYLEIPIVTVKINGVNLEKNPVQPDIVVKDEFDAEGRDLFLEKALEVLQKSPSMLK